MGMAASLEDKIVQKADLVGDHRFCRYATLASFLGFSLLGSDPDVWRMKRSTRPCRFRS